MLRGARWLRVSGARLRAGLLAAVWAVPWPIDTGFDEGSRYNTLLQISVGQEEIDEVRERHWMSARAGTRTSASAACWVLRQRNALHGCDG